MYIYKMEELFHTANNIILTSIAFCSAIVSRNLIFLSIVSTPRSIWPAFGRPFALAVKLIFRN